MKDNLIYNKAFEFAVVTVNLYKKLQSKREFVISNQLLRSGTSIGANIREGLEGQSKKDFISKLSIALKEAGETEYWLDLLVATDYLKKEEIDSECKQLNEIIRILNAILKTSRKNLNNCKL